MTHDEARRYYAHFGEREWSRLTNPADGALEFAVNRSVIARHLAAGARCWTLVVDQVAMRCGLPGSGTLSL